MEPTAQTFENTGRLCAAWALLESVTETTLRGLLNLSDDLVRIFIWKMPMEARWKLIIAEAKSKVSPQDFAILKAINSAVIVCAKDRNIIVHGVIHAKLISPRQRGETIPHSEITPSTIARAACWSIFMGEHKNKNFPVSSDAVNVVVKNIQKISKKVTEFNLAHQYPSSTAQEDEIQANWPIPLEL